MYFLLAWMMLWSNTNPFLMYETDRFEEVLIDQIHFDCLYYYVREFSDNLPKSKQIVHQTIPYCIRPFSSSDNLSLSKVAQNGKLIRFDHLRDIGIRSEQLYNQWFVSVDVAERYEMFLYNMSISEGYYYNCSSPYFGDRCQYKFGYINNTKTFSEIVDSVFLLKSIYRSSEEYDPLLITNLTCYVHLNCDRGPPPSCLDWREVCDGKTDCLGGNADEKDCFEIELTNCDSFRCHIGQCIPDQFFQDDPLNPDCLDGVDEPIPTDYKTSCVRHPGFRCEESKTRGPFYETCGDGSYETLEGNLLEIYTCGSKRTLLLRRALVSERPNNMSESCWLNMWCPHPLGWLALHEHFNELCKDIPHWYRGYKANCPTIFFLPPRPIFFGHVRFAYMRNTFHSRESNFIPDYICYDEILCDKFFWTPINIHGHTCISGDYFRMTVSTDWSRFLYNLYQIFRFCLPYSSINRRNSTDCDDHQLYSCQNSLKCISKHRLMDGFEDCFDGDDEVNVSNSCSLPDARYRYRCKHEPNKCISPIQLLNVKSDCQSGDDEIDPVTIITRDKPSFSKLCDRYVDIKPIEGLHEVETDETHCEQWPCNNIYTRCDQFWNCRNGSDESKCVNSLCPFHTHPCLSPFNNELSCLPIDKADDGQMDCRGGTDERYFCRDIKSAIGKVIFHFSSVGILSTVCKYLYFFVTDQNIELFYLSSKLHDCHNSYDSQSSITFEHK